MRRAAAALALAVAACAGPAVVPLLDELTAAPAAPAAPAPRWPAPPGPAYVRYLGSITGRDGFERGVPLWRRVRDVITGHREPGLVRPAALCIEGDVLWVTDPGGSRVHRLDLATRRWSTIEGDDEVPLVSPIGIACHADGSAFLADSEGDRILHVDADGAGLHPVDAEGIERPTGLALDPDGTALWVAETRAHRVRRLTPTGRELARFGSNGSGEGRLNHPTYLSSDGRGGVWVADSLNFRLQHFGASGATIAAFGTAGDRGGTFARPRGLAVDAAGRIFAVDALFDAVQIFSPAGRLLLVFGGRGTEPGQMWLPADVALDGRGHVFVADSYNRRIQIFAYSPPPEEKDG